VSIEDARDELFHFEGTFPKSRGPWSKGIETIRTLLEAAANAKSGEVNQILF
jgi:hypothetical protein